MSIHEARPSHGCSPARVACLAFVAALVGVGLEAQAPDSLPTLNISIKGSPTYGQPTPVPIKTALLVVTPNWLGLNATTPTGGREAPGKPLFVSDLVVVFSNQEMDCGAVFKANITAPGDFMIAAGKTEAYAPDNGWQSTTLGKLMSDPGDRKFVVDRFSVDAQFTAQKKKTAAKDGLGGGNGRLILEAHAGSWIADFMVHADELTAEGRIPVQACGVTPRQIEDNTPLVGQRRLQNAADKYGM